MTWIDTTDICPNTFGRARVLETVPFMTRHDAALLRHNSLYTPGGVLLTESTYSAGVNVEGVFDYQVYAPMFIAADMPGTAPEMDMPGESFWIGYFHTHFGHFLTSTLQRLWALDRLGQRPQWYIAPTYAGTQRAGGFIDVIMSSLGIDRDKILSPPENTMIRQVTVAESGFVENAHCYTLWGHFMREIGQRLLGDHRQQPSTRPVFLSRSDAHDATRSYEGEALLCSLLEEIGVEICHPQNLSIRDQLALWESHTVFIGFSGSAFLNAAFFRDKSVLILNHDGYIFGTQRMIDELCGNKALYLDVSPFLNRDESNPHRYRITDHGSLTHTIIATLRTML
ncbi:glycosyltransferase family 61 protein [Asaia krungthepensis]|uniref:Capsular polysaccharide biosynthesis protein-like protein n=1 Tax=Asaia krungthepensis NRIC 0535 TaxID=1307925 RepID=A0ABQ0Q3W6_9PROT|nr:glycosyltransferase family 61 protein [Asaia krungthepensis]GBQ90234.1 capsular polysaccharide biosynthesis protein-like protein [Asaia krungthepensis NRIC 0535]